MRNFLLKDIWSVPEPTLRQYVSAALMSFALLKDAERGADDEDLPA